MCNPNVQDGSEQASAVCLALEGSEEPTGSTNYSAERPQDMCTDYSAEEPQADTEMTMDGTLESWLTEVSNDAESTAAFSAAAAAQNGLELQEHEGDEVVKDAIAQAGSRSGEKRKDKVREDREVALRPRTVKEQGACPSSAACAAETVVTSRRTAAVGSRAGERKRQLETRLAREAALRPRLIPSPDEATTAAQGTMARLLAKVKSKSAGGTEEVKR